MIVKTTFSLVGFEVLTAVKTNMAVFWVMSHCLDDGGSKDL
jgi:hypothetical protein